MADGETARVFVLFRPLRAVFQHARFLPFSTESPAFWAAAASYANTSGFAMRRRVGVQHLHVLYVRTLIMSLLCRRLPAFQGHCIYMTHGCHDGICPLEIRLK